MQKYKKYYVAQDFFDSRGRAQSRSRERGPFFNAECRMQNVE